MRVESGTDEAGELGKDKTCRILEALLRSLDFLPSALKGFFLVRMINFDFLKRMRQSVNNFTKR